MRSLGRSRARIGNATQWRVLEHTIAEVALKYALRLGSFGLDQARIEAVDADSARAEFL